MIEDDVFVILLKKYLINILKTIHEANILFSGRNIKSEIDNERRKLILSIDDSNIQNRVSGHRFPLGGTD